MLFKYLPANGKFKSCFLEISVFKKKIFSIHSWLNPQMWNRYLLCVGLLVSLVHLTHSLSVHSFTYSFIHQLSKCLTAYCVSGTGLDLQGTKIDIAYDLCPQEIYILD